MSTCFNGTGLIGSSHGNGLKNRPAGQNEGSDAWSESNRKRIQRFNAGVIVDVVDPRAPRVFMNARLCKWMRMDQDAVMIMILMNVLERREAKC